MGTTSSLKLGIVGLTTLLSLVQIDGQVWAAQDDANANAAYVRAYDSVSGQPVGDVQVHVRRPGWYWSETHREPRWFAFTDSTGSAHLESIPTGEYDVRLCHEKYERREIRISLARGVTDTLRVKLLQVGYPHDGRRCETVFILDENRRRAILERWRHGLEAPDTVTTTVAKPKRKH